MANRVHPTPIDADNSSGCLPAARNDWRFGDADSMSARTIAESTTNAGYTTAGASPTAKLSVSFLRLWGSQYMKGYATSRRARPCSTDQFSFNCPGKEHLMVGWAKSVLGRAAAGGQWKFPRPAKKQEDYRQNHSND